MIITHNTTNYLNMTLLQRNHCITNIYNNMSLRNITFCNFRELYILTVYFPFFCSKQSWSINYLESLFQILRAIMVSSSEDSSLSIFMLSSNLPNRPAIALVFPSEKLPNKTTLISPSFMESTILSILPR